MLTPHESVRVAHRGCSELHGTNADPSHKPSYIHNLSFEEMMPFSHPILTDALCDALALSHRPRKHTGARSLQTWA